MGNANPAGKSADGGNLPGSRPATPPAPRRLSLLGLMYGVGTWLQFLLASALVLPVLLLTPAPVAPPRAGQRAGARWRCAWPACGSSVHGLDRAAAALRRGRQPQQLSRRRGAGGDVAALLQLRHQARNVSGATGRHAAAPHRRRVRRARRSHARRARCAPAAAQRRQRPGAGVLPRRHVRQPTSGCCAFISAPSPPRRAPICRWCRWPSAAPVTACRRTAPGRGPGTIEVEVLARVALAARRAAAADAGDRAALLRDAARAALLAALGETRSGAMRPAPRWHALNLRERYARELAARGYSADAAQSAAIGRLEALRDARCWREAAAALAPRCDSAWLGSAARQHPTRGVYLWGGVGRGKTWLMDLFYDSLPSRRAAAVISIISCATCMSSCARSRARREPLELLARAHGARTRACCAWMSSIVSDIADAMLLGGLFQALLRHGVALVITSNVAAARAVSRRPAAQPLSAGDRAARARARGAGGRRRRRLPIAAAAAPTDLPGQPCRRQRRAAADAVR